MGADDDVAVATSGQPTAPHVERAAWALTFDRSPVGMALVGIDGRWIEVNDSLCLMLGYTPSELMQLTFQDITVPDDLDEDLALLEECLAGARDGYRLVKRYVHSDGRVVWGDLSVALVRDTDGSPLHFISQILDISEHRADQDRLERAFSDLNLLNTDLARFAGVVSHDLKTPLTSMKAALELLIDQIDELGEAGGEGQAEAGLELSSVKILAARAEASTERMAALIDALLAYTTTDPRRGAGLGAGQTAATRIVDVARAAMADVRVMLESSGSVVTLAPAVRSAPACQVSMPLVRTVLVNLLTNAVKYRDPARVLRIEINARHDPGEESMLVVSVVNDGPRISDDDHARVFDYLSRGGHDAVADGSGIGLAACRRVIEWHGGRIWIEQTEGAGTAFCLTLPLAT